MRSSDLSAVARTRASLRSGVSRRDRAAAGLSAAEVARAVGVSRQTVSAWELGKSVPSVRNALAYGKVLAAVSAALSVRGLAANWRGVRR